MRGARFEPHLLCSALPSSALLSSPLLSSQHLRSLTLTYLLTLLLFGAFISQSWSAPKVSAHGALGSGTSSITGNFSFSTSGLLPAQELDPAGYAVPEGNAYVGSLLSGQERTMRLLHPYFCLLRGAEVHLRGQEGGGRIRHLTPGYKPCYSW